MLTVSGAIYKDVDMKDFQHYFGQTAMMWKLSPTKRRLFIVGAYHDMDTIGGTYLTREHLLKEKKIVFDKWWEVLDPIVMQPLTFNVGEGCAIWKHSLQKNLRKSFPWIVNNIRFFGALAAKDKTMQAIAAAAFSEIYGVPKAYPSLREALGLERSVACSSKFLIDRVKGSLYYGGRCIGKVSKNNITLWHTAGHFKALFASKHDIPEDWVSIQEKPVAPPVAAPKPKAQKEAGIHQIQNPNYTQGYNPGYPGLGSPGYCVIRPPLNDVRSYAGIFPGHDKLIAGWTLYSKWCQE